MLSQDWNTGGGAIPPRGAERPSLRDILNGTTGLTLAQAKALPPDEVFDGLRVYIGGKRWVFSAASALANDDQLVVVPTVQPGGASPAGAFLLEPGQIVDLRIAISKDTLDTAVLYAMPTGSLMRLTDLFWEVTADWTGGMASAIGISSNKTAPTNWSTAGDLLGGAAGDVAATLVAATGIVSGTVGTDMDTVAKRRGALWKAANNFVFNRITSAFTAGTGFLRVQGELLANAGA